MVNIYFQFLSNELFSIESINLFLSFDYLENRPFDTETWRDDDVKLYESKPYVPYKENIQSVNPWIIKL